MPDYGSAAQQTQLMKQTFDKKIELLENVDQCLDKRFTDMGDQTITSLKEFRMQIQPEMGGSFSAVNTDGGALPLGTGAQYDQGTMIPFEVMVAITKTDQQDRIMSSGKDVVVTNSVNKLIADSHTKMATKRNKLLQGTNTGQIATIANTYAGGGANPIALSASPFGARLIDKNDYVIIMSGDGAYTLRGTAQVVDLIKNGIGVGNQITLDAVPGGVVAGDFIMVAGVAALTPLFFNGLQYMISPSATGEYLGMSRALSYTQSPGYNATTSGLTLDVVQAFQARMQQALGIGTFKDRKRNFWYGHQAQWLAWRQLGFAKQTNFVMNGVAKEFDGVPDLFEVPNIGGVKWEIDTIAATDKIYFLDQTTMVRCRLNKAPQFFEGQVDGIWNRRPGPNGQYLSQLDAWLYDAVNYACRNVWANGVIYNLAIPTVLNQAN